MVERKACHCSESLEAKDSQNWLLVLQHLTTFHSTAISTVTHSTLSRTHMNACLQGTATTVCSESFPFPRPNMTFSSHGVLDRNQ